MPNLYLSPSVQYYNEYITGGDEEYHMNLIADAMVPYLRASAISFTRNDPGDTLAQIVERSNSGGHDFHLALHSNAAPEHLAGILRGPDVYYYAYSSSGEAAAHIFTNNLKTIYPDPSLAATIPNATLAELQKTRATALLAEIAYHDNYADATWMINHSNSIAKNLVLSLTEYFKIPFVNPY